MQGASLVEGWLSSLRIADPIDRRAARVLRLLAVAGVLWATVALVREGLSYGRPAAFGYGALAAVIIPSFLVAVWLVGRGRLVAATWLLIAASVLGPAAMFVWGGLTYATHGLRLVAFPLVLAALILGRRGVWTIFGANALLLAVGASRDAGFLGGSPRPASPPALGLFGGTLVFSFVLALLLDQLGGWLRESLADVREGAERLRVALATFPDLILMARADGVITSVNEGFTRLTGWEPAEVLGKTTADFDIWADPTRRAEFFSDVLAGKIVENLEVVVRRRDGELRTCLLSARAINVAGERHVLGMARDITERRRAEEERAAMRAHLDALYETTADLIWAVDAEDFRLLSFNRGLSEYFRKSLGIVLTLGSSSYDHFPDSPERAEQWRARYRCALAQGPFSEEYVVHAGNRTLQLHLTPLKREGRALGVSVFGRDVTEQKTLQKTLQQAQKMEALGRLSGGMAHDFNNVLSVVRASAALMEDSVPADSPLRADIEAISAAADRGAALTRQLLDFSRQDVHPAGRVDATQMLREVGALLPRVLGSSVKVRTAIATELGAIPLAETQVQQVLLNLAINARDAMPEGGTISLEAERCWLRSSQAEDLAPGDYVKVVFRDTGSGMTEEVQRHLFEPFFTTKPVGIGTGLGLSTSRCIVRDAGGTMTADSAPGAGATFTIWLPVVPTLPLAAPRPEVRGRATVLVVDDEPEVLGVLSRIVTAGGHRVVEASGTKDALYAAERESVDALVSDLVLREGDGLQVVEGVRRRRPEVGVVLTSGFSDKIRPPAGTGIEFVPKPFAPEKILGALNRVLGRGPDGARPEC